MKFLILTEPDDSHAVLVQIALEKMEHPVRLLFTADHPTLQKNSIYVDNYDYQWRSTDRDGTWLDNDYETVWWRRPRMPYLPKDRIHTQDYKFVLRENILFYEALTYNMAPHAWWINAKEAANKANSKLLQLKIASQCGMSIPLTLCSNDPKDIRYFLLKYEAEGVIYKPLCPGFWFEDNQTKIAYTSQITFLELPHNQLLQLTPGIYQKKITKKYELRITCFGNHIVAAKLNSQEHESGLLDWRAIPQGQLKVEPYDLPLEIKQKIIEFMRKFGIVFGCFDFIVTPDGEYVFLEVNEQGQFLWIEDYNPQFKMLDIFINFLLNKSENFIWNPNNYKHSINHYSKEVNEIVAENLNHHVDLNSANKCKE